MVGSRLQRQANLLTIADNTVRSREDQPAAVVALILLLGLQL